MKIFVFLFPIIFIPCLSFASDLDDQINKACLHHAISLVSKLKSEVIEDLSQKKSDQALKLTTDSCQAYFKKEFNQNPESIAAASNDNKSEEEDEGVKDWLTEKILSDDVKRKKGNDRLRNMKR